MVNWKNSYILTTTVNHGFPIRKLHFIGLMFHFPPEKLTAFLCAQAPHLCQYPQAASPSTHAMNGASYVVVVIRDLDLNWSDPWKPWTGRRFIWAYDQSEQEHASAPQVERNMRKRAEFRSKNADCQLPPKKKAHLIVGRVQMAWTDCPWLFLEGKPNSPPFAGMPQPLYIKIEASHLFRRPAGMANWIVTSWVLQPKAHSQTFKMPTFSREFKFLGESISRRTATTQAWSWAGWRHLRRKRNSFSGLCRDKLVLWPLLRNFLVCTQKPIENPKELRHETAKWCKMHKCA